MMRSYLLAGLFAALCTPTYGLVFHDRLTQEVDGSKLSVLHGVDAETSVKFGSRTDSQTAGWKFDTDGYSDDQAIITPLSSSSTLACAVGSKCKLDLDGHPQVYRVTRVDQTNPIFTLQDVETSLYVSRSSDLNLELTEEQSDSTHFQLEKITGNDA
ncbi:hypothetical protein P170DRAFT_507149 [Aspergillus steynii IBT 23096]|uniref:Ricin B lectin domain-containing protein n=1 Tax=Aspergillus steynii IBT 23096 TaxID=1392250 RepID=A0A2I2GHH8_9EURO|nr:uncharacterized protein P170DRAFT_507149 [Aspergillus steynii IBT 23096]PLB52336.1 hypothetical protein P170DRAFT_507149 [Aspergillus steynii IBT 23096]